MNFLSPNAIIARDPLEALAQSAGPAVMAIITGVEGPSYRPVGASMAVFPDGTRAGTLSSGCIESDIAMHARETLRRGTPLALRYGRASPFIDIQLPCGGGLDILLVPNPDRRVLAAVLDHRAARRPCLLAIDSRTGALRLGETGTTGWTGPVFSVRHDPPVQFLVFGKGPEACTFAALVQSAGYPNRLLSQDDETLDIAAASGCSTARLTGRAFPPDLRADSRTAVLLFFHDHDWEPPILRDALQTEAFYIGAQGSQRARDARHMDLRAMGVSTAQIARLHGPIGLIRSARDAGTLAVSVLAEVLAVAMAAPEPAPAG